MRLSNRLYHQRGRQETDYRTAIHLEGDRTVCAPHADERRMENLFGQAHAGQFQHGVWASSRCSIASALT